MCPTHDATPARSGLIAGRTGLRWRRLRSRPACSCASRRSSFRASASTRAARSASSVRTSATCAHISSPSEQSCLCLLFASCLPTCTHAPHALPGSPSPHGATTPLREPPRAARTRPTPPQSTRRCRAAHAEPPFPQIQKQSAPPWPRSTSTSGTAASMLFVPRSRAVRNHRGSSQVH